MSEVVPRAPGSYNTQIRDITTSPTLYEKTIQAYWKWILGNANDLKNKYIVNIDGKKIALTRGCYEYTNVVGTNNETGRRNLCGSTPQLNVLDEPYDYIFVPLLDSLEYTEAIDPSGGELTVPKINSILAHENDAVSSTDLAATIQKKENGSWDVPLPIAPQLLTFRTTSPADSDKTFVLTVPKDSALADQMEFPLKSMDLHARAEGYYLLIEKPPAGTYRIFSRGYGLRNFQSLIQIELVVT